jgi:hypothetical protein
MEYKMKLQSNNFICINEIENEFQKVSEIYLKLREDDDFGDGIVINKTDLHKFIGTLLHIQAKMK